MNLLPIPRSLKRRAGVFVLPRNAKAQFDDSLPKKLAQQLVRRLASWNPGFHPEASTLKISLLGAKINQPASIVAVRNPWLKQPNARLGSKPNHPKFEVETYTLEISSVGIRIEFKEPAGLRAAIATLRQMLREYGRRLPCLKIHDRPVFPRRGVMLDVSRGRVPNLATLIELADRLADFKINELQLYTEHTFAYRSYKSVWRDWGALTASEIRALDTHCRELGIDLVPNQNSFGHLREFLASPKLRHLAEISAPWPDGGGTFWRYPATLAPNHHGTLPFLRGLYDELLPNFSSRFFNVGCDETWDLGRGQSKRLCDRLGRERVYLNFIKRVHREVSRRGRRMMFWGDIILRQPKLIRELPKDIIALNWGYEADHPFERETRQFAKAGIPFYVCPGTSTWATLIGKHDNAFGNLRLAARAGVRSGAIGYLITDWGDGGHPQPLAVSWLPNLFGAAMGWSRKQPSKATLLHAASRDVFHDPTGRIARAAMSLGEAHRKLRYVTPNATPLGATLAAPRPEMHELFCRDGIKYYARLKPANVRATLREIEAQRKNLKRHKAATKAGQLLADEIDLAARMASQSCKIMLWQKELAKGHREKAKKMALTGIRELTALEKGYNSLWQHRNKATPAKSSPFFQWRIADYVCGRLHFPPEIACRD